MRTQAAPVLRAHFEDENFLVVEKPSGVATTSPDGKNCLTDFVQKQFGLSFAHPSSRLDREVSGLVTFAKTQDATAALLEAREKSLYRRRYLALVEGCPQDPKFEYNWPIGIHPRDAKLRAVSNKENRLQRTQDAQTRGEVVVAFERAALLILHPQTGRTHQLRVHCQEAKHPILGDRSYGGTNRWTTENGGILSLPRVMLHCAKLSIQLPEWKRLDTKLLPDGVLEVKSNPPEDFMQVWKKLGGTEAQIEEALNADF